MEAWSYELAPDLEAIRPATLQFGEWAAAHVGVRVATECELALVEACNNLVMHGRAREAISIHADVSSSEVSLVIRDTTEGFAWPEKTELPEADEDHGRGIFLIHTLMTEVNYQRHAGWNELRLRKKT